jgi:glutamine phosphoribosylpyrophosphate amidotransferase
MCGVFAAFSERKLEKIELHQLNKIFEQSRIRGLHAYGISWLENGKVNTFKSNDSSLVSEAILSLNTNRVIGHTRYSTSGDYKVMENNQPIAVYDAALVFNGVISMATKEQYEEEHGEKYITENDGEIVLKKYVKGEDFSGYVFNGKFSFAGCLLSPKDCFIFRNKNRPLWSKTWIEVSFVASTEDIFLRAGIKEPEEIKPGIVFTPETL